jgi:hypothetical protein
MFVLAIRARGIWYRAVLHRSFAIWFAIPIGFMDVPTFISGSIFT